MLLGEPAGAGSLGSGDLKDPSRAWVPSKVALLEGSPCFGVATDIDQVMRRERTDNVIWIICLKASLIAFRLCAGSGWRGFPGSRFRGCLITTGA